MSAVDVRPQLGAILISLAHVPAEYLDSIQCVAEAGDIPDADLVWLGCDVLLGRAA